MVKVRRTLRIVMNDDSTHKNNVTLQTGPSNYTISEHRGQRKQPKKVR